MACWSDTARSGHASTHCSHPSHAWTLKVSVRAPGRGSSMASESDQHRSTQRPHIVQAAGSTVTRPAPLPGSGILSACESILTASSWRDSTMGMDWWWDVAPSRRSGGGALRSQYATLPGSPIPTRNADATANGPGASGQHSPAPRPTTVLNPRARNRRTSTGRRAPTEGTSRTRHPPGASPKPSILSSKSEEGHATSRPRPGASARARASASKVDRERTRWPAASVGQAARHIAHDVHAEGSIEGGTPRAIACSGHALTHKSQFGARQRDGSIRGTGARNRATG